MSGKICKVCSRKEEDSVHKCYAMPMPTTPSPEQNEEDIDINVRYGAVNYPNIVGISEWPPKDVQARPTRPDGWKAKKFHRKLRESIQRSCHSEDWRCCCDRSRGSVCYRDDYYNKVVQVIETQPLFTGDKEEFIRLFNEMGLNVTWC